MALWFPRLSTDRLQRHERAQKPSDRHAPPLVVVEKVDNALRLSAVDHKATSLGLFMGQPLANARAMVPALEVVMADPQADKDLILRIAEWCDRFTPLVAVDFPSGLFLDITGVAHLFGGERKMLAGISDTFRTRHFSVQAAIARTAAAARALARYQDGTVVADDEQEKAVKPLPVEALNLDAVTTHALRRAGLKTVGQVASRKRSELVSRLGASTLTVLDEMLGSITRPITPLRPQPDYWQEKKFAEPIATEEVIYATLNTLATALAKILEQQGEGARQLEAVFFRADGLVRRIAVESGSSTHNPAIISRLFHERLSSLSDPLDPGFGFDLVRLCASRVEKLQIRAATFNDASQSAGEINFLIDRLAARFGGNRTLTFQPHDTHIPEEAWVAVPAQHVRPSKLHWRKIRQTKDAPRRPLRLFARPERLDFVAGQNFVWRKTRRLVSQSEGPERITMEWWRHNTPQPARDYVRVEDSEGKRYWLYRNDATSQWFLHGIFA
jgi:protein ImuB